MKLSMVPSVKGFGCRSLQNLAAAAAGRRPNAAEEGTRGKQGSPGTARRYEDFDVAISVAAAFCMAAGVTKAKRTPGQADEIRN